ncbi:MAG: hypothetical protein JF591_12875 [Lysobacter sp.]|nr:hypothetical protein [Lysobacter sp.]
MNELLMSGWVNASGAARERADDELGRQADAACATRGTRRGRARQVGDRLSA